MKDYLSIIILFCIKQFNGERSLSAIYYLLKGKKSSQTIQDSKLYQLSSLFQLFPSITKNELQEKVSLLEQENFLIKVNENSYMITEKGHDNLRTFLSLYPIPKQLNGWQYHPYTNEFWNRLALFVQSLSNLVHGKNRFIPIVKNEQTLQKVKAILLKSKKNKAQLSFATYQEIHHILNSVSEIEANIFTLKLTSYQRIGLTTEQIATQLNKDIHWVHVCFIHVIHTILYKVFHNKQQYPWLFELIRDIYQDKPLTLSTKKTYQLFLQGKTITEIAQIRNLKISTIEDHIVELAHNIEQFEIQSFIEEKEIYKISKVISQFQTNSLKEIKQALDSDISYFKIRLVLAKSGERNGT